MAQLSIHFHNEDDLRPFATTNVSSPTFTIREGEQVQLLDLEGMHQLQTVKKVVHSMTLHPGTTLAAHALHVYLESPGHEE